MVIQGDINGILKNSREEFERLARAILELRGIKKNSIQCCSWIGISGREYSDEQVRITEGVGSDFSTKRHLFFEVELILSERENPTKFYHNPVFESSDGVPFRFHGDHLRGIPMLRKLLKKFTAEHVSEHEA